VTPMPGLIIPLVVFTVVYIALGVIVIWLIGRQVAAIPHKDAPRTQEHGHAVA